MRLRLCGSLLGSVAVCTSSHKLHWCYFSCPIFCAGYVMGAVKQEQIWICTCWGFPLDVIPLDLFLSFWKSCFMSSGRSVAMPYFFHVLSSCQLRCQKVDLLKCSGFSFCLLVFRLFLGGFLFDWTSRSSLFWFELSEDNEVCRQCFLFVLFYLILMWFPLRIFWLNRPRVQAGAQADCAAHAIAGSGWKKTAIVPILFFRQGVETSGEGAAARASAEPEARVTALLAVAGAGSHALGDAA